MPNRVLNALENFGIRADKADESRNIAPVMLQILVLLQEGTRMMRLFLLVMQILTGMLLAPLFIQITSTPAVARDRFQSVECLQVMLVVQIFR